MAKHSNEPELGSSEHAILTTLRTYRPDLDKISDEPVLQKTIDAMVQRMRKYDKQTEPIANELGPRIRALEARYDPLPKNHPQRAELEKQLIAVDREWDRRERPLSKALHADLDKIVRNAVAPYRERQRALVAKVNAAGKSLRSRELADAFRQRQRSQHVQGKDMDREK
jgi:hypothetical protein